MPCFSFHFCKFEAWDKKTLLVRQTETGVARNERCSLLLTALSGSPGAAVSHGVTHAKTQHFISDHQPAFEVDVHENLCTALMICG